MYQTLCLIVLCTLCGINSTKALLAGWTGGRGVPERGARERACTSSKPRLGALEVMGIRPRRLPRLPEPSIAA